MKAIKTRLATLLSDQQGTSVMEFGLICIPICIMMLGTFDVGHTYYVKSVLSGEMNKLARSSSLEGNSVAYQQCLVDERLKKAVNVVAPTAKISKLGCSIHSRKTEIQRKLDTDLTLTVEQRNSLITELNTINADLVEDIKVIRRYYKTFSQAAAARAEEWTDTNNNGKCDAGEPYVDANVNNTWDDDGGDGGQGGAKDVVIIKVNVTFKRLFPMKSLIGADEDVVLISDSVLANQPFGSQSQYTTAVTRNCPV